MIKENLNHIQRINSLKLKLNQIKNQDFQRVRKKILIQKFQSHTPINTTNFIIAPKRINNNNYYYNQENNKGFSNLYTHYDNKRLDFTQNINNIQKNKIQRNKMTHTPILIRKNKTLNDLDLNGINNKSNIITKNNKYKINNINKIKTINIINKTNDDDYIKENSTKYTTTSGGSIVSIHNNKIHGLPILQGVCPRCINSELVILKELNKKINKYTQIINKNYDMFENEKQRDKELKDRILLKVKYNKNRLFPETQNYEKNKLIERNSKAECKLFKPSGDPIKEKVMEKFFQKEQYFRNKKLIPYNVNIDADKYLKNNNNITKFSVPSIGLEKYKNKYLPTMEQYIKGLSNQIINKKNEEEKEKQKEKEEFKSFFKNDMIKAKNDIESKYLIEQQKKKEFLDENLKLIEMKKNKKILDKSTDIALEQKRLKFVEEKEKKELENQRNKKYRIKKELMEKLNEQIQLKRNKSFDKGYLNNENINDCNVFRENKNNEQFGRCLKCFKLLRKNQICPKEEYEKIKTTEIQNRETLNKILNKNQSCIKIL